MEDEECWAVCEIVDGTVDTTDTAPKYPNVSVSLSTLSFTP